MKVLCSKLPSKGFGCTLELLEIKPLTYAEVLNYASQGSSGELDDFIWDFENLIMTLDNWEKLSSFDCFALFAYRKMLSIDMTGSFKLFNGESFSLKDIDFTDIDKIPLSIESVTLNNKEYKPSIKNLESFYKTLKIFQSKTKYLKFPLIASFLGESEPDAILNLTAGDISICESFCDKLISQPKIKIEGGAEVVLYGNASDLFQNILELSRIAETSIRFSEVSSL